MDCQRSGFGLDAVGLDDRIRLSGLVTAANRHARLWILRAVELPRAGRHTVLPTDDIAASPAAPSPEAAPALYDAVSALDDTLPTALGSSETRRTPIGAPA